MKRYRVTWAIDIDADTPEDAARKALAIQRNPHSIATWFEVQHGNSTQHVDLDDIDPSWVPYVVLTGDPGSGFTVDGPHPSLEAAEAYIESGADIFPAQWALPLNEVRA